MQRGNGFTWLLVDKRADKLSTRTKKPTERGRGATANCGWKAYGGRAGGPSGVPNLCGLPDGADGGKTFALNLSGPNNFGFFFCFFR